MNSQLIDVDPEALLFVVNFLLPFILLLFQHLWVDVPNVTESAIGAGERLVEFEFFLLGTQDLASGFNYFVVVVQ